ncbi:MAG: aminotransferase class I/II-fold pyridoxal phosphate-dependent enzyme, partial [Oligoflexia bacterium]|nr:aminotransferase class I/II-fold pyridoxal phosphate-dependent enzyme [Oligoflexia bacterium]
GLAPCPTGETRAIGPDDTVIITGGTRGIGAALASHLATHLASESPQEGGPRLILVGRSAPAEPAAALVASGRAVFVAADVTDRAALHAALSPHLPDPGDASVIVVHAAGVLADGPLGAVDAAQGRRALDVKVQGWLNVLSAVGDRLAAGVALGSLAGRFGNRHQAWYAAANALLSAVVEASSTAAAPCASAEFGPWVDSEMVKSIPAGVQGTMRAEGVDFVGTQAGLDALLHTVGQTGPRVMGRDLPWTTRTVRWTETLSTKTHPFLLDHAIAGVPVLPLASATDLLASAALPEGADRQPFEILDLRLFQGVTVTEPVTIELRARGDRAELRFGDRKTLAYKARVRPLSDPPEIPAAATGGQRPTLSLDEFYGGVTFHGPLLQGIVSIDGVGTDFVYGTVRTGQPDAWIPDTRRGHWTVDPLALDSAMQLSAHIAWTRYHRAGTPIGIDRYVQLAPLPGGDTTDAPLRAEVWTGEVEGDRFTGTIILRDETGRPLAMAEGVAAELREVQTEDAQGYKATPRQVDFAHWPEAEAMEQRLQAAEFIGIANPFFRVHQGTAKNTSVIEGREYVNYSSYNYIGLSGDPRVLADVRDAVDRYGTSVSASRVASGERPFHHKLEALLAKCQDTDDALVFTAGHATNVTTVGHLMGPDDLVLHDELIHDSALQGIKLSGSTRRSFKHNDPVDLERQLRTLRANFDRCLIIVEGVYSMDGDVCDLPPLIPLKKRYGCLLMVDEAHSFGIIGETGCGLREYYGIPGRDVDIWMGTLSKSLASCGGWIAGSQALINYLKYTAPGFVYSAGITAANGVAALRSLELMLQEPHRVKTLQDNAAFFHAELIRRGLNTGPADGESGVIPVVTGNSVHALWLSQRLVERGINVQPIVYPAVADDAARLRFFLSSTHTRQQLEWTARIVQECLDQVRVDFPL